MSKQAKQVEPKIFLMGQREFRVDRFESDYKICTLNDAYKDNVFLPLEKNHKHFFNTHTKYGKKLEYSTWQNGHAHEILEVYTDEEGYLKIKCGPCIKKENVTLPNGVKKTVFYTPEYPYYNDKGDLVKFVDNHTHEFTYMGSNILSADSVREMVARNREEIAKFVQRIEKPSAVEIKSPEPPTAA